MSKQIRVSSIAPYRDGKVLFGKRRHNGKWNFPGGHLNEGEEPVRGAVRELLEETSLKPKDVEYLGHAEIPSKNLTVYSFRAEAAGSAEASGDEDPDNECSVWTWVDEDSIPEPLHNEEDVTLQFLGLQEQTLDLVHADEEDLDKMALRDIPKGKQVQVTPTDEEWDYSHVLPPQHQGKYSIRLSTRVNRPGDEDANISVRALDETGQEVGHVRGGTDTRGNATIDLSGVHPSHRQKGLGTALYEAFYSHALNHFGAGVAVGGYHSTSASATQNKLAGKHGLGYKPVEDNGFDLEGGDVPSDFDDRYQPYRYTLKSEIELEKGLRQSLAGLGAAVAMSLSPGQGLAEDKKPAPVEAKWTPKNLHQELVPIAHLESSFGKKLIHAPHSKGTYHTAYGAVGLKAVTGHEEYRRSPELQKLRPGLATPQQFEAAYKQDPEFYNAVASAHWKRLRNNLGSTDKTAYGWRWGIGAARKATPEQIQQSPYVKEYKKIGLKKSEELDKMAISDIKAGKRVVSVGHEGSDYDYSHVLSPEERAQGYKLVIRVHLPKPATFRWDGEKHTRLEALLQTKRHSGEGIGTIKSLLLTQGKIPQSQISEASPGLHVGYSNLHPEHRGRGLGVKMYEALYSHAQKKHGARVAEGDWHSTSAHKTHASLSRKHGLDYKPHTETAHPGPAEPFDNRYKDYSYTIKSESNMEPLTKAAMARGWKPAFYNKATDHTVVTPGFHNPDLLPGGEFTDDWEDGFVDAGGAFYTREEAKLKTGIQESQDLPDRQVPWQKSEQPLEKAQRSFRSRDGIHIPAHGTSERIEYDKKFAQALVDHFGDGEIKALKKVRVPVAQVMTMSQAANQDRLDLYRRMAKKDRLPPVVVRKQGDIFTVVDGNHRVHAAAEAGLTHVDGYEIVPVRTK